MNPQTLNEQYDEFLSFAEQARGQVKDLRGIMPASTFKEIMGTLNGQRCERCNRPIQLTDVLYIANESVTHYERCQ